jgi:hypothetical protein
MSLQPTSGLKNHKQTFGYSVRTYLKKTPLGGIAQKTEEYSYFLKSF